MGSPGGCPGARSVSSEARYEFRTFLVLLAVPVSVWLAAVVGVLR